MSTLTYISRMQAEAEVRYVQLIYSFLSWSSPDKTESYHLKRASWAPFFDDGEDFFFDYILNGKLKNNILRVVQAILFLAPLAFNLTLEEDPRVNRLVCDLFSPSAQKKEMLIKHSQEDSLNLWRQLCSNRLLAAANLIVFFNKVRKTFLSLSLVAFYGFISPVVFWNMN